MDLLPTYEEAEIRVENGTGNELDAFIFEHTPADQDDEEAFRAGLQDVLAWYNEQ